MATPAYTAAVSEFPPQVRTLSASFPPSPSSSLQVGKTRLHDAVTIFARIFVIRATNHFSVFGIVGAAVLASASAMLGWSATGNGVIHHV